MDLEKNPGTKTVLSPEVFASSDAQSILAAWRAFDAANTSGSLAPFNQAKLLVVRNEAVGKTSLVKFLLYDTPCDPHEEKTPAINQHEKIETSTWRPEGGEISLNVWDFGGQEIMHGTHRYFLTARSVYVLALEDRREDDTSVETWMRTIASLGKDSPVLVVINKSDEGKTALRLDEDRLAREFPQIVGFMRTSCRDNAWSRDSIKALRAKIADVLYNDPRLENIRSPIPKSWLAVKDEISKRAKAHSVLEYRELQEICVDPAMAEGQPIADTNTQNALLRQLHELGVIIANGLERHAPVAQRAITLLDPNWLTKAIYKVLNEAKLHETGGRFSQADLSNWLDPTLYPEDRHEFILSMMKDPDIGLCFRLPGEEDVYLAPEALPKNTPDFSGFMEGALRFRLRYSFMPASLIPRFIVQASQWLSEQHTVWRTGAQLKIDGSEVVILGNRDQRTIEIAVKGKQARHALTVIRQHFEKVHNYFSDLDVEDFVPMPDDPNVEENYEFLQRLEGEEGPEYKHRPTNSSRAYSIKEMLENIGGTHAQLQRQVEKPSTPTEIVEPTTIPKRLLQPLTLIPLTAGALAFLLSYFEYAGSFIWSLTAAFTAFVIPFVIAWFIQRFTDRKFFFRRIFGVWVAAGLSLLGANYLTFWFQNDNVKLSIGAPSTTIVAIVWVVGFLTLGILAYREAIAKASNP